MAEVLIRYASIRNYHLYEMRRHLAPNAHWGLRDYILAQRRRARKDKNDILVFTESLQLSRLNLPNFWSNNNIYTAFFRSQIIGKD